MERLERIVLAPEAHAIHMRGAHEPAVERIGPTMIGTQNTRAKCSFGGGTQAGAAMAADVIKGADGGIGVAHDDQAFAREIAQEVVAGVGDDVGAPGAEPAAGEESFNFVLEPSGIGVVSRRQRLGRHGWIPAYCTARRPVTGARLLLSPGVGDVAFVDLLVVFVA